MRLFVAIRPAAQAIEDLDAFLEVRREAAGFRWSPTEQWHLTLAFTAELPERKLDDLLARVERAAYERRAMRTCLAGGGAFPHVGAAKVLWTGLEVDDPVELERLATGARAAVSRAGGEVDGKHFRAHLTLARSGRPFEATTWVRLLDGYRGPQWQLDQIEVVASYLGEGPRRRPRHETLAIFSLSASPR